MAVKLINPNGRLLLESGDYLLLESGDRILLDEYSGVSVQMEFSGAGEGWKDVSSDVLSNPGIVARYGIFGDSPVDRVAGAGTMEFSLRNDARNSGAQQGYYSPDHSSVRSGFGLGVGTRLAITYSASTFYKWVGWTDGIKPEPGKYLSRRSHVRCVDWFDRAATQKMRLVPVQISKTADQAIASVIGNMSVAPAASSLATGQTTFPTVFDATRDEATVGLRELQKIVISELGHLYPVGDQTTGGVVTFDDRHARPKIGTSSASFNDNMVTLETEQARDRIFNRVKVNTNPREVSPAASIIYTLQSTPLVPSSGSVLVIGQYTDPANRGLFRIGGASMVTPASTTDYTMNSASDGTGTDLTANFLITASYGGNSVAYSIVNAGGQSGYVTLLQARGRAIAVKEPVISERSDTTSILAYDEHTLEFDMPYLDDPLVGDDAANALLAGYKNPFSRVSAIGFIANDSDELMQQCLLREPGDRITIVETVTGIDMDYFINGVELTITAPDTIHCRWAVVPADTQQYWILGVAGSSELGVTTFLGY